MSSGGTPPDLIFSASKRYCTNESPKDVISLNDFVAQYGAYIHNLYDNVPDVLDGCAAEDGLIYSLPIYSACLTCRYSRDALINKGFLEALGMNMPSTVEAFEEYLSRVKYEDPNDNQIQDEIPYTGTTFGHSAIDDFLLSPFLLNRPRYGYYFYVDENEKLSPAFIKEDWKDGLKWMAKLYGAGLVDSNAFSVNHDNPLSHDPSIVGAYSEDSPFVPPSDGQLIQRLPSLTMNDDYRNRHRSYALLLPAVSAVIPSDSAAPEIAFRWLDGFYENDAISYAEWGEKWRVGAVPFADVHHNPTIVTSRTGPAFGVTGVFVYDKLGDRQNLYSNDELLGLQATIKRRVEEYTLEFVTGSRDIDDAWDSYLADLKNIGLDRFVEINQQTYDSIQHSISFDR